MTNTILKFYSNVERIINGLVTLIVNIFMFSVTTLAPLAAPIAPAFSVYKALSERLETPFSIAIAGAIAIEITGMFVSKTAIGCHNWNSARNKTDPVAPRGLAISMASVFFVVVLVLSLTIELRPELAIWVYPCFVFIAICVYVSLAIANNLAEWTKTKAGDLELRQEKTGLSADIRAAKADLETLANEVKKLAGERAKLTKDVGRLDKQSAARTGQNSNGQTYSNAERARAISGTNAKVRIEERRRNVLALKAENLTNEAIAHELDVSLSTVKTDLKQLNGSAQ